MVNTRVFKINNTWLGFHNDIAKLVIILRKNLFPAHLVNNCIYRYLNTAMDRYGSTPTPSSNITSQGKQYFYKLPYLGRFSTVAQNKIRRLVNRYCNDLDIKLVFTAQNVAVNLALQIVSKFLIPPPINFNLNLRRPCTLIGRSLI